MPTVKVRRSGQLPIPAFIRRELHLEEDASLTVVKVGDVLLLTPRKLIGDAVAKRAAGAMKQAGLKWTICWRTSKNSGNGTTGNGMERKRWRGRLTAAVQPRGSAPCRLAHAAVEGMTIG